MTTDVRLIALGTRVVVRHRLAEPDGAGHTLTDVVGSLLSVSAHEVVVDALRGPVTVPLNAVVATKVVPPRPTRRGAPHLTISINDLERVMVDAWPPLERARLGDWVLRAGRGFTHRANSVATIGSAGRPLAQALEEVEGWYAARALASGVVVAGPVGFDLATSAIGSLLLSRGYLAREPTLAYTAAARTVGAAEVDPRVELSRDLTDAWLAAYGSSREVDEVAARGILTGSPEQAFALVRDGDGSVVGVGRLAVARGWGGIAAMWVAPTARRRGIAGAMLTSLARCAAASGVLSLHVQTDVSNAAARATYEGRGFVPHHAYVNLSR